MRPDLDPVDIEALERRHEELAANTRKLYYRGMVEEASDHRRSGVVPIFLMWLGGMVVAVPTTCWLVLKLLSAGNA